MQQLLRIERRVVSWTRALALCGFVGPLAVAIVIATSFPIVVAQRQNITIRFLGDVIGPRTALWFDAFGSAVLLAFITFVGWQLSVYAAELIESGRVSWQLRIPVGPYWTIAAAVVVLCIPIQAILVVADVARALTGAPRAQEGTPNDGPGERVPETLA
jgi:hypothetical protein